jgi:hypothetical protein
MVTLVWTHLNTMIMPILLATSIIFLYQLTCPWNAVLFFQYYLILKQILKKYHDLHIRSCFLTLQIILNKLIGISRAVRISGKILWPVFQSQGHIATDGQSVNQSVLVSSPNIYYCLTVTVLLLWDALSDEKTGLSFVRVIVCSSKSFVIM